MHCKYQYTNLDVAGLLVDFIGSVMSFVAELIAEVDNRLDFGVVRIHCGEEVVVTFHLQL